MSREKLQNLEKLEAIDIQVEEISKRADEFPAQLAEISSKLAKAKAEADAAKARVVDNERSRINIDRTLAEEREKVKKWEGRLAGLKHQREYLALQREIESSLKSNAAAEEQLKLLKESQGALEKAAKAKDDLLADLEMELMSESDGLKAAEAELRAKAAVSEANRGAIRASIDKKLLQAYDAVRRRRGGKVIVPIRNSGCGGCNMRLSPQIIYRVAVNAGVEVCPACQRILFEQPALPT